MSPAWPSVDEERLHALRDRLPTRADRSALDERLPTPWRRNSSLVAVVFFVLTCMAVSAFAALCELVGMPFGLATAAACLGLAQLLIRGKHFFGTGVESALWISGLVAFVFDLPGHGGDELVLLLAAAAAVAGWRMHNAWFGALAAVLATTYLIIDDGTRDAAVPVALVIALVAALALGRRWQRRSTDKLFAAIVGVMPFVTWIGYLVITGFESDLGTATLFFALAAVFFGGGLFLRHRALFLAGATSLAIAGWEARDIVPWSPEWKLVAAGATLLATAAAISHLLRGRLEGIVVHRSDEETSDQALQMAGALTLASHRAAAVESSERDTGGGDFGGGGASGRY